MPEIYKFTDNPYICTAIQTELFTNSGLHKVCLRNLPLHRGNRKVSSIFFFFLLKTLILRSKIQISRELRVNIQEVFYSSSSILFSFNPSSRYNASMSSSASACEFSTFSM